MADWKEDDEMGGFTGLREDSVTRQRQNNRRTSEEVVSTTGRRRIIVEKIATGI